MKKIIKNEKEFVNWFKKHYQEMGYTSIIKENKNSFPDFIILKSNKKLNIELELRTSHFLLHKHQINRVDEVICIENDAKLNTKVKAIKNLVYKPYKAKRINMRFDERQLKLIHSIKGMGTKEAEIVKNILLAYLSEKGYIKEFNKK